MKCAECGYVSFDDLGECKRCGATFDPPLEAKGEAEKSRLQEDLFSLKLDEEPEGDGGEPSVEQDADEEEREGSPFHLGPAAEEEGEGFQADDPGERGSFSLPEMNVDYDPAEEEEEGDGPGEEEAEIPGRIIDDESFLPEEIWVDEGAGFLTRLAAFGLDALAIAAVLSLFLAGAILVLGTSGDGWGVIRTSQGIYALSVPFYLLGLFVSLCYFTFFPGWMGRTPGKALLGLDLCRTDGGPMTYSRAFLRWVGYLLSFTAVGLGFLWVFFDERRRGWHDYLSGTWVKDLRGDG